MKLRNRLVSIISKKRNRKRDLLFQTYELALFRQKEIEYSFYEVPSINSLKYYENHIIEIANNYCSHKFDLLGSGWTHVYHGLESIGLENHKYSSTESFNNWEERLKNHVGKPNLSIAINITDCIDKDYIPIDWQIDFKSGYRWNSKSWYKDIQFGESNGADIKVPWELGRMQHLIPLAYAHALTNTDGKENNKYLNEFKNQVLDFIGANPPRFGVQWMTSMDIGIRAVNFLVAYDMFISSDVEFDEEFKSIFFRTIAEHGKHILNNLEWSSGLRGNHYLTNIVSLIYIYAYLPVSDINSMSLAFSIQELINEIYVQFLPDGGNFEASTNYHSLTAEMVFHAIALILSLPPEKIKSLEKYNYQRWRYKRKLFPSNEQYYSIIDSSNIAFPNKFWALLNKIALFSFTISNQNGSIAQIGDNDSGRFLKLTPDYSEISIEKAMKLFSNLKLYFSQNNEKHYLSERINDQRSHLSIFAAILDFETVSKNNNAMIPYFPKFEYEIIKKMLEINRSTIPELTDDIIESFAKCDRLITDEDAEESGVLHFAFPKFGLYINKTYYYFSTVRCGSIGQWGKGGHAHNDQLSIDVNINGFDFIVDPGTYLYTAIHEKRNLYRSSVMHNTLSMENLEQNCWKNRTKDDLFWMCCDKAKSKVLQFSDKVLIAEHQGFKGKHKRILSYDLNMIAGIDICDCANSKEINFHLHPNIVVEKNYSDKIAVLTYNGIIVELTTENGVIQVLDYNFSPAYGVIQPSKKITIKSADTKIKWLIEIITI